MVSTFLSAQNIDLFQQFNGNYDFTAIGNTLNTGPNACNILTQSSANLTLTANQDLVAARLYWSGSGGDLLFPADNNVTLNSKTFNYYSLTNIEIDLRNQRIKNFVFLKKHYQ